MAKFGCPSRFIAMIASIQNDGEHSEPFPLTCWSNRAVYYIEAPTLFMMVFSAMLTDASKDCNAGVKFPILCRFDGKLFNIR